MNERRQAFRREPIEVELDNDLVISVAPVDWIRRSDFGNEVIRQNTEILNEAVRAYSDPDTGAPQLEMKLAERFNDGKELLRLGLDTETFDKVMEKPLYQNQLVELLLAICDVNELKKLKEILDPNFQSPTGDGTTLSTLVEAISQRTESGLDSSLQDSGTTTSETEPSPKSQESSMNSSEESGMIETGILP
jgi:hypothetical protein